MQQWLWGKNCLLEHVFQQFQEVQSHNSNNLHNIHNGFYLKAHYKAPKDTVQISISNKIRKIAIKPRTQTNTSKRRLQSDEKVILNKWVWFWICSLIFYTTVQEKEGCQW